MTEALPTVNAILRNPRNDVILAYLRFREGMLSVRPGAS
jgi:hypothetical protein